MKRSVSVWMSAVLFVAPAVFAQDQPEEQKTEKVRVGDKAPDFELPSTVDAGDDAPRKLSDLRGKKHVVLAFYPKADTPGCTKQLCGYRDDFETLKSANTEVVAISVDQQIDSDKFKEKFSLPFPVVGDPQHKIIEAYGIPMKDVAGNKFAQRAVILIDKEGTIRHIDLQYDIANDKAPLYERIHSLDQSDKEKAEG
ncbi:MAG: hypothetical protein AMXMBFR4_16460 [Candidatus Hydrogenedentota bacterium]